ncbi:hypothetical protein GQX73_g7611 [Xylaria multiplex]|uniref:PD-(D/E)XK nuclease-like domain-containing protein n=1 Tax=Xylaria multiplex TaxID=323545 RepID=A0A7C8MLL8_9PEZI|nr:hypothetical protein GQX73_g7611 [Xylaria multiplex]
MHKSAIEVWLQGVADYYGSSACPNVEDLHLSDGAPTPRAMRGRVRATEETGRPEELAHSSGTKTTNTRAGSSTKRKTKPPQGQSVFVDGDRDALSKLATTSLSSPTDVTPGMTSCSIVSFPSISASSARTAKSGRSKSPVRTLADLAVTSKSPTLRSLDGGVPGDAQDLLEKLYTISCGENLIPAVVAGRFKRSHLPLRPWQIDNITPPNIDELEYEINKAQEISERANLLAEEGHSEPSWNCEVHSPILRLGLTRLKRVRHFNITTATLCPSLLPIVEKSGETLQSKPVDYSLNLVPAPDTSLADAINVFVDTQPPDMRTISPTMYDPVRRWPQAVAIGTRVTSSSSDPLVQLTVWAQATFTRFRQLIHSKHGSDGISLLTLPVIAVYGHEWHLWFSRDTTCRFELYGPLKIGSTETLLNTFKLIRSLRTLAEWVDTDFCAWVEKAFALPSPIKDTEG